MEVLKRLNTEVPSGTSLVVQWVRLCTPNAEGPGFFPGPSPLMLQLTIPRATAETLHSPMSKKIQKKHQVTQQSYT